LSLEYFEGPAGSGKTYNLIRSLEARLASRPLGQQEAVLGITYMHGSRRRMHTTLAKVAAVKGRFHACTVDSLVRTVVFRWRSLGKEIDPKLDVSGAAPDFKRICQVGAALLEKPLVAEWLARRYPVVLVDELQDCRGDHLRFVRAMESFCHMIAAADEFQDLVTTATNEAVEWLHCSGGQGTILSGNRRTGQQVLLRAANSLRSSQDCGDILGSRLNAARNANVGAGGVARALSFNGWKDVVILTPTGPDSSAFVRKVVERLIEKPIQPKGVQKAVGPCRIEWESSGPAERTALLANLGDVSAGVCLEHLTKICVERRDALGDLHRWSVNQFHLKGTTRFNAAELENAADRLLQSRRAFLPDKPTAVIRAMTINQAKNREFEGVIILWPFEVGGPLDGQRRRLYNAITRAKKWVCVVVQENAAGTSRLGGSPFSKTPKA
jgi:hypothetical protein